jgi:hypothetical protein
MQEHRIAPEIEIFDLSHIHATRRLIDEGMIGPRPHIQFVMGVKNAMPADEVLLDILLAETRRVIPGATWTAAGIGREQMRVMEWALVRGADAIRTGMEDNIRVSKDRLTTGNDPCQQGPADDRQCGAGRPSGRGDRPPRPSARHSRRGSRHPEPHSRLRRSDAQGDLKLSNGHALTGHAHNYKRHGTNTLFAAFDIADGAVTARHYRRRRRIEFLHFMNRIVAAHPGREIHVILDNLNTHKPKRDHWLAQHKNVHFHYTPTRASWLN